MKTMKRTLVILGVLVLLVCAASLTASAARPYEGGLAASAGANAPPARQMVVRQAARSDISPQLRAMQPIVPRQGPPREMPLYHLNKSKAGGGAARQGLDAVIQKVIGPFS